MNYRILFIILSFLSVTLHAQKSIDTAYFDNPIKHELILAGSFGELRSSHFHAGIDIKPSSKDGGDSLFVAAEGYISRIKIQTGGYGRSLYVDHPNGFTTVYAHMMSFNDSIEAYIQKIQLSSQSYEVDIYPQKEKFVVPRKSYLGKLGNTGRSYGAHLHFEIRNTKSETPINPALFGIKPKDTKAPNVASISVHGLTKDYQETYHQTYPTKLLKNGLYTINNGKITVPAWRIGVLVEGWDQMNGATNKNGIYSTSMYVDDTLTYKVTLDSVKWDETAYIVSHVDYADREENNRTSIRCYQLPGNKLSIYDTLYREEIFPIYQSIPRKIKIESDDIDGNQTVVSFEAIRDTSSYDIPSNSFEFFAPFNEKIETNIGSSFIYIPPYSLDRDLYFQYSEEQEDGIKKYHIHKDVRPLMQDISVSIPLNDSLDSMFLEQLCVVSQGNNGLKTYGGQVYLDRILFQTGNFGTYYLHIDTIPPSIKNLNSSFILQNADFLSFKVKDDLDHAGQAKECKIDCYIDGQWAISPYKVLDNILTIPMNSVAIGKHNLMIVAIDDRGNKAESTFLFEKVASN